MFRDAGSPHVELQFPSSTAAPAAARAFLGAALHAWNLDGFGQVAALLGDELVSNVVRHVGQAMTLRATRHHGWIRVEVSDPSPILPVLRHVDFDAEHGRGMQLVDALSDRWGTEPLDTGKSVWFELDVDAATDEVHGD